MTILACQCPNTLISANFQTRWFLYKQQIVVWESNMLLLIKTMLCFWNNCNYWKGSIAKCAGAGLFWRFLFQVGLGSFLWAIIYFMESPKCFTLKGHHFVNATSNKQFTPGKGQKGFVLLRGGVKKSFSCSEGGIQNLLTGFFYSPTHPTSPPTIHLLSVELRPGQTLDLHVSNT